LAQVKKLLHTINQAVAFANIYEQQFILSHCSGIGGDLPRITSAAQTNGLP
jgi:hypothetical protein